MTEHIENDCNSYLLQMNNYCESTWKINYDGNVRVEGIALHSQALRLHLPTFSSTYDLTVVV